MYWGGGLFRGGRHWNQQGQRPARRPQRARPAGGGQDLVLRRGRRQVLQHLHLGGQPERRAGHGHAPRYRDDRGVEVDADRRRPGQRATDVLADGGRCPAPAAWPRWLCHHRRSVTSVSADVVAERQMYWGPGAPSGIRGGHAAAGVTTPSATWLFAEGIQGGCGSTFDTFVLLFNQNATPIDVTVEFFGQAGAKLAEDARAPSGPGARQRVGPGSTRASIEPGVLDPVRLHAAVRRRARRVLARDDRGPRDGRRHRAGAEVGICRRSAGRLPDVPGRQRRGQAPLQHVLPDLQPGRQATATVTVYFYTEGGNSGVTKTMRCRRSRARRCGRCSTTNWPTRSSRRSSRRPQPIVVERVVYWGRNNKAGHASLGTRWLTTSR